MLILCRFENFNGEDSYNAFKHRGCYNVYEYSSTYEKCECMWEYTHTHEIMIYCI